MGYLIQVNTIKGYIEERRVNGVGVSYSINIQYFTTSKCSTLEEIERFSIYNSTNSERRFFSLTQIKSLITDCNDSETIESSAPKTIKISGSGPLPLKYIKLYQILEGKASLYGDTKVTFLEEANYKLVDPSLVKTNILFSLLQLFPTELISLSPSINSLQSTNQDTSSCCVGEVMIIARLLKPASPSFQTYDEYAGTIQVYTTTKCLDKIMCEGLTDLPLAGYTSCLKEATKLRKFSATDVEFEYIGNLYFFGDEAMKIVGDRYKFNVKAWKGAITIRQAVKLGCCVNPCPDKVKVKTYINSFGSGQQDFDIRTIKVSGEPNPFTENSLLVRALLASYGIGNDENPIKFKSCSCSDSYTIEGTSTASLS